jgi:competence protein ComEA
LSQPPRVDTDDEGMRTFIVAVLVVILCGVSGVSVAGGREARPPLTGVVNINTATSEQLQLLPGIGPAKAKLVIEYRTAHAFRTIEELARVKGIGPKTVRKLRANLTVRGTTTVSNSPSPSTAAPAPVPDAVSSSGQTRH